MFLSNYDNILSSKFVFDLTTKTRFIFLKVIIFGIDYEHLDAIYQVKNIVIFKI